MAEPEKHSELQSAVEDVVGFNFRSLKTLRDLFVRPNTVFRSYAARDRVTYTPALRLWAGVLGISVLVSALWGGWPGIMRRQIESLDPNTRAIYVELSQGRMDEFIGHYGDAMNVLHPIVVGLFTLLSIFALKAFNNDLPWTARLNIAMGILTVGSLIGLLLMPFYMLTEHEALRTFGTSALIAAAYMITFVRGAPGVLARGAAGAWAKGAGFALLLLLLMALAGMVLGIITTLYAWYRIEST